MSIILTPFAKLLLLFYDITGSYGMSLLLFCLVIRLILFPFFLKGRKSMLSMSGLTEKQKVLQQKYARDRQKYSEELQKLYDEEGIKPSSGCLWSFLPLPFLMAIYGIIRRPLTYLMSMTSDNIESVYYLLYNETLSGRSANAELSMAQDVFINYDKIVSAIPDLANMPKIDFSFLGLNLTETPHFMFWNQENVGYAFGLWLIPVVSAVLSVVSMIVTNRINASILGTEKVIDQSQRTTMIIMPLFSLWIGFSMPAAMCIYWIAQAVFNTALDGVLTVHYKKVYDQEDEIKRERAAEEAAIEAEKEARRAERRAMMPEGANPNTSRRKIKKQQKLAEADTPEGKFTEEERAEYHRQQEEKEKAKGGLSGDPNRPYSRGRAYDPNRYQNAGDLPEAPAEPEPETPEDPTDPE